MTGKQQLSGQLSPVLMLPGGLLTGPSPDSPDKLSTNIQSPDELLVNKPSPDRISCENAVPRYNWGEYSVLRDSIDAIVVNNG